MALSAATDGWVAQLAVEIPRSTKHIKSSKVDPAYRIPISLASIRWQELLTLEIHMVNPSLAQLTLYLPNLWSGSADPGVSCIHLCHVSIVAAHSRHVEG